MPTPEIEQEGAIGTPPVSGGGHEAGMTVLEKMVTGLLAIMSTAFLVTLGIAVRRKNKEQGAEDFVWAMSNKTIERLNNEVEALSKENALVRGQKNQFETAAAQAQARAEIASQAAELASRAALANVTELARLRRNWEKLRSYTHELRSQMADSQMEIPPEPEFE